MSQRMEGGRDDAARDDARSSPPRATGQQSGSTGRIAVAWAVVGIPLGYGVSQTLLRAADLFTG